MLESSFPFEGRRGGGRRWLISRKGSFISSSALSKWKISVSTNYSKTTKTRRVLTRCQLRWFATLLTYKQWEPERTGERSHSPTTQPSQERPPLRIGERRHWRRGDFILVYMHWIRSKSLDQIDRLRKRQIGRRPNAALHLRHIGFSVRKNTNGLILKLGDQRWGGTEGWLKQILQEERKKKQQQLPSPRKKRKIARLHLALCEVDPRTHW